MAAGHAQSDNADEAGVQLVRTLAGKFHDDACG